MNPNVRILKSTTEDCPHSVKQCLTLYFNASPTVKQIMHTAAALRMGHRIKPDLNSRNLRIYTSKCGDQVKCQLVD